MTRRRLTWSLFLGAGLALGVLAACAIDPEPPDPHGDAGDPPGDPPDASDAEAAP
jgi:hypothetical protein